MRTFRSRARFGSRRLTSMIVGGSMIALATMAGAAEAPPHLQRLAQSLAQFPGGQQQPQPWQQPQQQFQQPPQQFQPGPGGPGGQGMPGMAPQPMPQGPATGMRPGEAFVTRFSGTTGEGQQMVIDPNGVVGSIIDIRNPGAPPQGMHWLTEPQRAQVSAAEVGQVFGVALDNANPPNIYLTATAAFGLHLQPGSMNWMQGLWGQGGGPGSVWRLDAANGYRPTLFAQIGLNGRPNTGAALGNIAFDRQNRQFFVSDMETGMIHRLDASGRDLGAFDHGVQGRQQFLDVASGQQGQLPPIPFDVASRSRGVDCPTGNFAQTPECWNIAPSGRRIWGVGVRRDPGTGESRLFYAVWSSPAFGATDWQQRDEEDQRNAIWSVRLGPDGGFVPGDVRREFIMPDFFSDPQDVARAGYSQPVSDITFSQCGERPVMLLAERGGMRNLGLSQDAAFATPNEARVLRYELDEQGAWRAVGRYDVGFYDRRNERAPFIRANCAGGVDFGPAHGPNGQQVPAQRDQTVWMTGDNICSPDGPCRLPPAPGQATPVATAPGQAEPEPEVDPSYVSGVQGTPADLLTEIAPEAALQQAYPQEGLATPANGPEQSYMIDTDINVDQQGQVIEAELLRNDATRIGDIAIYQDCEPLNVAPRPAMLLRAPPRPVQATPVLPGMPAPPITGPGIALGAAAIAAPIVVWAGHGQERSHAQVASHGVRTSHYRFGSHSPYWSHSRWASHNSYWSHSRVGSHSPRYSHYRAGSHYTWGSQGHLPWASRGHFRGFSHDRQASSGHWNATSLGHRLPFSPGHIGAASHQRVGSQGHVLRGSHQRFGSGHDPIRTRGHDLRRSQGNIHTPIQSRGGPTHNPVASRGGPGPVHTPVASRGGPPNHNPVVSRGGPPTHNPVASRGGPPTHNPVASRGGPPTHNPVASRGGPPTHNPVASRGGPPTHNPVASRGGPPTHNPIVSRGGPPTHTAVASRGNITPGGGRDQHTLALSRGTTRPPGGHTPIASRGVRPGGHTPVASRGVRPGGHTPVASRGVRPGGHTPVASRGVRPGGHSPVASRGVRPGPRDQIVRPRPQQPRFQPRPQQPRFQPRPQQPRFQQPRVQQPRFQPRAQPRFQPRAQPRFQQPRFQAPRAAPRFQAPRPAARPGGFGRPGGFRF